MLVELLKYIFIFVYSLYTFSREPVTKKVMFMFRFTAVVSRKKVNGSPKQA